MKFLALALLTFSMTVYASPANSARSVLKRNLQIVNEIPSDLGAVSGFDGDTKEFNPYAADAAQSIEAFDEAYRRQTGDSPLLDGDSDLDSGSIWADWLTGGCYREGCPVFAYISRAEQKLTLYLNGTAVDQWLVSTGMSGFATPQMDQHVSSRVYNRYSSKKYPEGDYNGLGNMPYAVFIRGGFAIHGTPQGNWKRLGRPASHGCIRLHPSHALAFNRLVRENGSKNVWVLVD